ncbi:MAG: beta-lactamase family protein [Gemmatimonadetes bacterium]|nr:beta-lactamase family protein [Gemmatimonadota bacterium]
MRLLVSIVIVTGLSAPASLTAQRPDRAKLVAQIDSIVSAPIKAGQVAGVSIAVVKGRDTIALKGYGAADLELDTPTPANAIYEIGSITKQFTAAAIMQLVEQGKVKLDDDLLTYLPTYPARGQHISIRRLLDHTSGIRSYTEIAEARPLMGLTTSKDSIMALFANKGFDFTPGEAVVYNNSAYFLLGMIIEKVSGQGYAEYVKANLFDKAAMPSSSYCSETDLVKRKVHGYNFGGKLLKAARQNHSWPYAAGSLCSTAGDLIAWLRALHTSDRVVSRASYREMITPGALNDGYPLRYAKGLVAGEEDGRRLISHGGGISGFTTDSRYYPDDDLYVVVLTNTAGPANPGGIATAIAKAVLGPGKEMVGVPVTGDLAAYTGRFRGVGRGVPTDITFTVEEGVLKVKGGGQAATRPLLHLGNDTFGAGGTRYVFRRGEGGRVTAVRVDATAVVSLARRVE